MSAACPICSSVSSKVFDAELLGRHRVDYFLCNSCGFLRTEKPYWLSEAYSEAIASADTGLVARNIDISKRLTALLFLLFDRNARYLDLAGGTGLLTRIMRDIGFDFYWHDPYCQNVHARGFEFNASKAPCEAVTAFEVLEHLEDPLSFVSGALSQAGADTFIFSTELYKNLPPSPGSWWYYSLETGQHIAFYQRRTLEKMAEILRLRLYTRGDFHILTKRQLPHWLYTFSTRLGPKIAFAIRRTTASLTMHDNGEMLKRSLSAHRGNT